MADSSHLRVAQVGFHADANDFDTAAGATEFVEPIENIDVSGLTQTKLERNILRGDNELVPSKNGPKATSISFSALARGVNNNDGTLVSSTADQDEAQYLMFAALGSGAYVSGGGDTVLTNTEASALIVRSGGTQPDVGEVLGFYAGTTTEWTIREVVTESGANLTLDRGGWSGTDTGQAIYGGITWFVDADLHDITHLYMDIEGENFRREVFGLACESCTINIPGNGGRVTYDFSFQGTNWSDSAEQNPTVTSPTVGSDIIAVDSPFYLGDGGANYADDTEWFVDGIQIQIQNTLAQRVTPSGANGYAGFHVAQRRVTISGNMYLGALTADGTDALLALMNTDGQLWDCGMQVGRGPGESMYWRAPALDITQASLTTINGMDAIAFSGVCTRSPNHSNVPGAFRIHLL